MMVGAWLTVAPNTSASACMPKQTPNMGLDCSAHRRIMPSLAPDSAGAPGPGEISTPSYSSITPSSPGSIASLRTTVTVAPNVFKYPTIVYTNES